MLCYCDSISTPGKLKNMPEHGCNQQFVEDWASILKFVDSIPTVVRHIFNLMSRTNVASVGSVFNDTRKVKVLSLSETIKEKSTFRAKVLRQELIVTPIYYPSSGVNSDSY